MKQIMVTDKLAGLVSEWRTGDSEDYWQLKSAMADAFAYAADFLIDDNTEAATALLLCLNSYWSILEEITKIPDKK